MCRKDRKDREAKKLSDLKNVFFYAQLTGNVRLACIRQKINLDHTNGSKALLSVNPVHIAFILFTLQLDDLSHTLKAIN